MSESIEEYREENNEDQDDSVMKNILEMPLDKKYRALLKEKRLKLKVARLLIDKNSRDSANTELANGY